MVAIRRGRKFCPFSGSKATEIDYKDVGTLKRFLTENFKIVPCRISGVKAKYQRRLAEAIKHARYLSLLPYTDTHE